MGLCRQADNALGAINPMRWEGHRLAGEPVFRLRCPPHPVLRGPSPAPAPWWGEAGSDLQPQVRLWFLTLLKSESPAGAFSNTPPGPSPDCLLEAEGGVSTSAALPAPLQPGSLQSQTDACTLAGSGQPLGHEEVQQILAF